jgi:uncharacterized FlaG/YvyC family protein
LYSSVFCEWSIHISRTDKREIEITALLNSTAPHLGLSAKQSSGGAVVNTSLKYRVCDKNKIAVTVIDKKSGEIIREIPPENLQKSSERMDETIGKSFDQLA